VDGRIGAILCFAAAAVLVGIGRRDAQDWLVIVGFALGALGAGLFFRWRSTHDGRVLDSKDKTSGEDGE
jgi:hypothetical protein